MPACKPDREIVISEEEKKFMRSKNFYEEQEEALYVGEGFSLYNGIYLVKQQDDTFRFMKTKPKLRGAREYEPITISQEKELYKKCEQYWGKEYCDFIKPPSSKRVKFIYME